ncbi:hypothetical protein KX729_00490 [Rhizobium sp. XQZ8]|uniref:hypothetical protein n=1 Tax=Rhizobium populisoli TaxID=2859785 RepID=UPI001CA4EC2A|nr:hypothetical protein [Rhizobium populisoli]MBW6419913.1 hypothetical protein [Rhizobium populisoli]
MAVALGAFVIAGPGFTQEVECHDNNEYFVASKTHSGDAGAQFAITALNGKPKPGKCAFDAKKADFVIGKPGDPLWFSAQARNLLILSRSTGPQGDLVVYDLKARKSVLDVPSDDFAVEAGKLVFWQRSTTTATKKNCPSFAENEKNGMGSVISVQKAFDIKTGSVQELGKNRCDATQ